MKKLYAFLALVFFFTLAAFANEPAPAPDLVESLAGLFAAFKNKAGLAAILVAVFQVLKTAPVTGLLGKLGANGQRIALALISAGGFVVQAFLTKGNWFSAAIEGLFVAGGAMLIYDAFKKKA